MEEEFKEKLVEIFGVEDEDDLPDECGVSDKSQAGRQAGRQGLSAPLSLSPVNSPWRTCALP